MSRGLIATSLVLYLAAVAWGQRAKAAALLASPATLMNTVVGQNGFLTAGHATEARVKDDDQDNESDGAHL